MGPMPWTNKFLYARALGTSYIGPKFPEQAQTYSQSNKELSLDIRRTRNPATDDFTPTEP